MADASTQTLVFKNYEELAQNLSYEVEDGFEVSVNVEVLRGLLEPFNGRARRVITGLLRGMSQKMAANNAGLDDKTVVRWGKREPEFAQALQTAAEMGFSRVWERELYKRAYAGPDDRASGRLLELVVKARAPEYREKQQVQMEVIHRAEQALGGMVQGWEQNEALDS